MLSTEHMERAVLGQMLYSPLALQDGIDLLSESDFAISSHRTIFSSIHSINKLGNPVDFMLVSRDLEKHNLLEIIGGTAYLSHLGEHIVRDQDIRHYCEQLRAAKMQGDLAKLGESLMIESMLPDSNPDAVASDFRKRLDDLEEDNSSIKEFVDQADLMPRTIEHIFGQDKRKPISTGLDGLDNLTVGGIRSGELWIVGGLPGRAKTSLARQIGRSASKGNIPIMVFTIEMPDVDWNSLDVAVEAGIPMYKMRDRKYLTRDDEECIYAAIERISRWPILHHDSGSIHIRKLVAKARLAVRKKGIKLVIVDYVQRIKSDDKEIRHRIGNSAEALAEFAKETGCAVVLLSQLSRQGDINSRPTMQHLKESGELEAHAHTILLNYRPVANEAGREIFTGEDEIIVAKQRYGPIGSIPVKYDSDKLMFVGRS